MATIDRPKPRSLQAAHIDQEQLAKGKALQW